MHIEEDEEPETTRITTKPVRNLRSNPAIFPYQNPKVLNTLFGERFR